MQVIPYASACGSLMFAIFTCQPGQNPWAAVKSICNIPKALRKHAFVMAKGTWVFMVIVILNGWRCRHKKIFLRLHLYSCRGSHFVQSATIFCCTIQTHSKAAIGNIQMKYLYGSIHLIIPHDCLQHHKNPLIDCYRQYLKHLKGSICLIIPHDGLQHHTNPLKE